MQHGTLCVCVCVCANCAIVELGDIKCAEYKTYGFVNYVYAAPTLQTHNVHEYHTPVLDTPYNNMNVRGQGD
jgi:hypothetical protein